MIGSLRGTVLERSDDATVLARGRRRRLPRHRHTTTLAELEPSSPAFLHVHHHIREDAQTLYGFLQRDERATFQILSPPTASARRWRWRSWRRTSPAALVDIVATNDLAALTLVPGVGKKTAERLLVELRNRLNLPMLDPVGVGGGGGGTVVGDVREALAGLGYGAGGDPRRRCASCRPTATRRRCCATR